jgi:hypothetical protein
MPDDKTKIIDGVSQDFNDNTGNPDTEFCIHCITYKLKSKFTNTETGVICDACNAELERLIKDTGITFHEVPGRKIDSVYRTKYTITDVYAKINGIHRHINGYNPDTKRLDLARAKASIFNQKMQLLKNNGEFITMYNHSKKHTPLEFIKWIKEIGDNFGKAYNCSIRKYTNFWEFDGNLTNLSCAFSFRIYSEELVKSIIEAVSDPYYKNISLDE